MEHLEEWDRRRSRNRFEHTFPDSGKYAREYYPKHIDFLNAGASFTERLLLGGNRVGKTLTASYEITAHATGRYPNWWKGKRFNKPCTIWAAGDTSKTARDIIQAQLIGPPGNTSEFGTGMIPEEYIKDTTNKMGLADAVETVFIRHISGGASSIQLKSFDQGREAFQGTACDVIWLDEEPPSDIVTECLLRLMTTNGILMITATPLSGLTELMLQYLPDLQPAPEPALLN